MLWQPVHLCHWRHGDGRCARASQYCCQLLSCCCYVSPCRLHQHDSHTTSMAPTQARRAPRALLNTWCTAMCWQEWRPSTASSQCSTMATRSWRACFRRWGGASRWLEGSTWVSSKGKARFQRLGHVSASCGQADNSSTFPFLAHVSQQANQHGFGCAACPPSCRLTPASR